MDRIIPKIAVCPSHELVEGQYRKLKMVFEGREDECLLLRFDGKVYAYINRCVHMLEESYSVHGCLLVSRQHALLNIVGSLNSDGP